MYESNEFYRPLFCTDYIDNDRVSFGSIYSRTLRPRTAREPCPSLLPDARN